ncbi:MAG: GGDEF domain-containing protein [Eubacterium sp.]|nr:GGDEF domain-containing protein [Eubacterium sp.]
MDIAKTVKISKIVNTVLLGFVIFMMVFFYISQAWFLVYFSIPTICVYLLGYYLIRTMKLYYYALMIYGWITIYMGVTTVCMGYKYGFHLYALSLIPIVYYINYLAYKIKSKRVGSGLISAIILTICLVSGIYSLIHGPIYPENKTYALIFCLVNTLSVCSFLIFYTKIIINDIIVSEEKLKEMSYMDKLTGLYNRHYMMERLEEAVSEESGVMAIMDIDDFKFINDEYGHNAGDYVLKKMAMIMRTRCGDMIISRWGGEEFLLLAVENTDFYEKMEALRGAIQNTEFEFEGQKLKVTVTLGVSERGQISSINKWVQAADDRLYQGKRSGKNKVVGL